MGIPNMGIISFVIAGIGWSILLTYHELRKENIKLPSKREECLDIKVLSVNQSFSNSEQQQGVISSWNSLIREVRISITNNYEKYISVKEARLEKLIHYSGVRSLDILPIKMQEEWKRTIGNIDAMPDNVYLGPGETKTGSYLFCEVVRMQVEKAREKIRKECKFMLIITDSTGRTYRNEAKVP